MCLLQEKRKVTPPFPVYVVMKSLKWTSQNYCEPKFIEALAALMLFNSRDFQMSATVQRQDVSCSGILWRWCAVCM